MNQPMNTQEPQDTATQEAFKTYTCVGCQAILHLYRSRKQKITEKYYFKQDSTRTLCKACY